MRAKSWKLAITILLACFAVPHALAQVGVNARGIVENAEISGIDQDELSQDIRDSVGKLVGQPFNQQAADDIVARIQEQKPEFTATTRLITASQPDHVKVVFFVEKANDDAETNVNSRYAVERVEIQGYDESKLKQSIRDALNTLVGEKLDQDKANEIQQRIEDQLRPRYSVSRRVVKGSDRQHIVVVFEVRKVRLIPFIAQPQEHILYHSRQNFSAVVGANFYDNNVARLHFGLADDQDPLLERYAGFNGTFETTKLFTDHLGIALRYGRYHERWQPATVLADQNAIYRERTTFDPSVTVGFDPHIRLTLGISLSDLQIQYPLIHQASANAFVASLHFQNVWGNTGSTRHSVQADYTLRAGNHNQDSDFIYTRHLVEGRYTVSDNRNYLLMSFLGGTIAGNAPLFDRFSLGNSETLRGWNKFDIAPAGGDRMAHATLQYAFGGPEFHSGPHPRHKFPGPFTVFYDTGVVGNHDQPMQLRHAAGFGFGSKDFSDFFIGLGFPIRSNNVVPAFFVGFRF
jgi:outer membrane protein assembly factor BamA